AVRGPHSSRRCARAPSASASCLHSLADLPQHIPLQELWQFQGLKRAGADADAAFDAAGLDHHRQEAAVGRRLAETWTGRGYHHDRVIGAVVVTQLTPGAVAIDDLRHAGV